MGFPRLVVLHGVSSQAALPQLSWGPSGAAPVMGYRGPALPLVLEKGGKTGQLFRSEKLGKLARLDPKLLGFPKVHLTICQAPGLVDGGQFILPPKRGRSGWECHARVPNSVPSRASSRPRARFEASRPDTPGFPKSSRGVSRESHTNVTTRPNAGA